GYETLKGIIETDEGSHRLGEIAMVGYDNPIRKLGVLFYNTLFDENASCHFAIGQAYASVKGADKMTEEEQLAVGLNQSATHVDFMVGTEDLSIVGIKNGVETPIFVNGDWAI
ncbi:MAG TPA: aminopeptidase, partial [Clostridiales bacterium]|nr:aminopeptidase [Clostridiales bacterium]